MVTLARPTRDDARPIIHLDPPRGATHNQSMTYLDLQRKLHDKPFKPFRIRLVNNTTYDVTEPWMVTVGESSAVIVTQARKDDKGFELALDWKTVSISHMLEFSDPASKDRPLNKKSA